MKKTWLLGLTLLSLLPAHALAQSAFDGTWKIDLNQVTMPTKPSVYLLKDGIFQCESCVPPIKVAADGSDQAVSGHPYFDTMAVNVVDDHTVKETDKKDGKVVSESTVTISPDGKTATFEFTDTNPNGSTVSGRGTQQRVKAGPEGSHASSGTWNTTHMENVSDNGLTMTFKVEGDKLSMSSPTGQAYTAPMDGTDAPLTGDPGVDTVSVKKIGPHSITETDKLKGKVISVTTMTVGADGHSMQMDVQNKQRGTTTRLVAMKESM